MTFDEFLATLEQALQDLPLKVLYHPTRIQAAEPDQILIGVGRWTLDRRPVEHRGVCLNNKGLDQCFPGFRYPSVTELALAPPGALTQRWDAAAAGATDPDALLRRFTLVVEDVGPDSCFALLCWLARRGGADLGESPASIATYGLPFFISGTITGFLSEWIEAWAMRIAWEPWTPLLKVGVYAAITGLLIAGIMALQRRVLDRSIQDRPDPPGAAEGSGRPTGFPDSKKSHEK